MRVDPLTLAKELSSKYSVLGNEIRLLIVAVLAVRGETSWSDLKRSLEALIGKSINPNVLAFHLRRLVEAGFVERVYTGSEQAYRLKREHVESGTLEELVKLVEEVLGESDGYSPCG